MQVEDSVWFYLLIGLISLLYSSVGHGGASGFLALMAVWGMSSIVSKPLALVLNLVVSIIAFTAYAKRGNFNFRLFGFLVMASIPMAYCAGRTQVSEPTYKLILGGFLLLASLRLIVTTQKTYTPQTPNRWALLGLGGGIGYLSGLIGIGGGILLSPILLFLQWSDPKTTAGISALFIFVNSAAVLIGSQHVGIKLPTEYWPALLCAILGGLFGSIWGSSIATPQRIKQLLGLGLALASFKLIFFP
jgi:uncharacterized membrane protein YfcA